MRNEANETSTRNVATKPVSLFVSAV